MGKEWENYINLQIQVNNRFKNLEIKMYKMRKSLYNKGNKLVDKV